MLCVFQQATLNVTAEHGPAVDVDGRLERPDQVIQWHRIGKAISDVTHPVDHVGIGSVINSSGPLAGIGCR